MKFLVSTIKFYTIDQIRISKKNDFRNPLIFDRHISNEGEGDITLGEMVMCNNQILPSEPAISDSAQFQASFTNAHLVEAFSNLSQKQQLITTLCYAMCYKDNEIAKIIGVSPQAICKTRNSALQKLRFSLSERR
ncbi:hypothetical protein [Paenibacillus sp. P46E]|uniref:hypothetical protein n=1 Tax=Paenibacillus sp. P46E TaxID=1349436 RepID=UPI003558D998